MNSIKPPFEAYSGDDPFIFISYSHTDSKEVFQELEWLRQNGFNVWYDEGISPGHDWPDELARAIESCGLFLLFVTPESARSENCSRETTFALSKGRSFMAVYLKETNLPRGLELSIGNSQALLKYELDNEVYYRKLLAAVLDELHNEPTTTAQADVADNQSPQSLLSNRLMIIMGIVVLILIISIPAFIEYEAPVAASTSLAKLTQLAEQQTDIIGPNMHSTLDAYMVARSLSHNKKMASKLENIWRKIAIQGTAVTDPPGVEVSLSKTYGEREWVYIGETPLINVYFPKGQYYWRFDKKGYHSKTVFGDALFLFTRAFRSPEMDFTVLLTPASQPLVERIPTTVSNPSANNYVTEKSTTLPPFAVDRYEVTNKQFKEFVDAGGYEKAEYWQALPESSPFDETIRLLVDKTGRSGPSTWEIGTYGTGEADFPVGGISWYEAMAYAKFKGASLPTISHWAHSSLPFYASLLAPMSNFNSGSAQAVRITDIAGPMGTYGTFGNVREWVLNSWGERRWILGGGWSDPEYLSAFPFSLPPMDRSEINGLRLYHFGEPFPDELREPSIASFNDYQEIKPVSDDTYAVIEDQYIDVGATLVAEQVSRTELEDWIHEIVRLNSDIVGEYFDLHIFLPKTSDKQPQVVTYFPPISDFWAKSDSHQIDLNKRILPLDKIPRSGRALVWPVYYGSFERYAGIYEETSARHAQLQTEMRVHWYSDLKRSLDYLETRSDLDSSKLAFLGYSYGASHALPLIALEDRYDTAILVAGGLGNLGINPMPQAADPVNFISRINIPVMMINGKGDFVFPMETSQIPFFELLGTPDEDKKKVEYEGDHYQIPATAVIRDIVNWLDEQLGAP